MGFLHCPIFKTKLIILLLLLILSFIFSDGGGPVIEDVDDILPPLPPLEDHDDPQVEAAGGFRCSCKHNAGNPCYTMFADGEIEAIRCCFLEMTRDELDIAILAKLSCGMHLSDMTSRSRRAQSERKTQRTDFYHHSKRICRDTFKYVHGIGQDKLNNLIKHYKEHGVIPRTHGNKKRRPYNAVTADDNIYVAHFVLNYAETHAMHLPGRVPGYWRTDLKLLPTNCSKRIVYDSYYAAVTQTTHRAVSLVTFRRIWREVVPFVVTMKPSTDLCWFCQKHQMKISNAANRTDAEKAELLKIATDHLQQAGRERLMYNEICKETKENLPVGLDCGQQPPCSFDGKMHYSMDFAQQVHYPSNPQQPGPVFFKTPRKCGVFGVACEALPKQVTFLLDESVQTGKGANCVISLFHFYLDNYGLGETDMHLHADNCSGQNKNSYVMWYMLWRVLTGRHNSITMSFLLAGHTKFSCDWCFGLFKRTFRRTKVDCLNDIADTVSNSSTAGVNVPHLCGQEDGTVLVKVYDWSSYLSRYFNKVKQIKANHHFHFDHLSTSVTVKRFCDTDTSVQELIKVPGMLPAHEEMPVQILPKGLDAKRKLYLFKEIREFVAEDKQDLVCPPPVIEDSESDSSTRDSESDEETAPPPQKRGRKPRGPKH